ncbi:O-methyltransferase [Mycena venus]|uniref:O-methyltransferase n=1 Tax=Mycena venus TaxID=2733690 RepID=A0A8H7DHB8_9AGAR|nr:O-methyltransferase [Mycena venus]
MAPKSHLRLLGELILKSIDAIESRLETESIEFPVLANPVDPSSKAESLLREADIVNATSYIVAAASQLIATSSGKSLSTLRSKSHFAADKFHLPACIRAAVESNMVEIIREAGHQGIHANDIAKRNNTDPIKTARILRLLSNHHIFTEVDPDVFCINRLSSVLDSGKSAVELQEAPHHRYVNMSSISALVLMQTDEAFKGAAYLTEAFIGPGTAYSLKATDSPWNIATQTDAFLFDWYDWPENASRKTRFSFAMACSTKLEPPEAILSGSLLHVLFNMVNYFAAQGFKWGNLPDDSLIVDLGGGVGSTALMIAKAVPHVKLVVQDRSSVIEDAKTYWASTPEFLESGRVKLQVHNFFEPQPLKAVAVFLLRWIMHDWADPSALQILQQLRAAATPATKLITVDIILPHTCQDTRVIDLIPGATVPAAPAPLLPNMGAASNMKYWLDFQMFVLGNCQERTLGHFVRLAAQGGWKVAEVHHVPGSFLGQCVSVPI